jgi:hypothetical protein
MSICNCHKDLSIILCDIPYEWRKGIVDALCLLLNSPSETELCKVVKECETRTNLSPFLLNGAILSVSFKDEKERVLTRTLDIQPLIEASLDDIDPSCLMSQEDWDNLTYEERIQSVIDSICSCCATTTTTSTSTTTTTSTSTTTTTSTSTSTTTTTTTTAPVLNLSISNSNHNSDAIAQVLVDAVSIGLFSGDFPIIMGETGLASVTNGTYTVTVKVGSGAIGKVTVTDSNAIVQCQEFNGSASYSFPGVVFTSTPVSIVISLGVC